MLQPLFHFYKKIADSHELFERRRLPSDFFIDIYRSQPFQPELYEYYSTPAIFVDYSMQGQGWNKPRLISFTLHVVTDELPDASSVSTHRTEGMKRFLYHITLQEILEGTRLGKTSPLRFVSENIIDEPVINYHTQNYEFEAYLGDLTGDIERTLGEFEKLQIFGNLTLKRS